MTHSTPKWFDQKTRTYMSVEEMHEFHILNARRRMQYSNLCNATMWVNIFNRELAKRNSNFYHMDGAPNRKCNDNV